MTALHTSTGALTLREKFGIRKASQGRLLPPEEATIILAGRVDAGKSTFLGSCPTLLRLDIDKNGSTVGQIADFAFDRDQPGPTWTQLEALCGHLAESKRKGECPYTTVAIDSLTTLLHLAMVTVEQERQATHPSETFMDLGMTGWTLRNRKVLELINRLRLSGLGVIVVVHLIEKTVPLGATSKVEEALDMSSGIWSDLGPICDIIAVLQKTTIDVEVPELNADGTPVLDPFKKPKKRKTGEIQTSAELVLRVPQSHPWAKFLKVKQNPLTSVPNLPIVGGWDCFREAFLREQQAFVAKMTKASAPSTT